MGQEVCLLLCQAEIGEYTGRFWNGNSAFHGGIIFKLVSQISN
jgi:hypothetical protein